MGKLKFAVISDPHYYSKKNYVDGEPFKHHQKNNQQYYLGSEEIVKTAFSQIVNNGDVEIVLINGDLVLDGDRSSHAEMIELLHSLKRAGKRVYITTATHDYSDTGKTYGFDASNNKIDVPAVYRDELYAMYYEFGFKQALSYHSESMSYTADLGGGFTLLAINDDMDNPKCGFSESCMAWILRELEKAKQDGRFVIMMTHHPLIPASALYKMIAPGDMLFESEKRIDQLAQAGVHFIFTGHSHTHNISCTAAENGTPFYAISTGSLTGYPPVYRIAQCDSDKNTVDISTVTIQKADNLNTNGKPLPEFIKNIFLGFVYELIDSAENDYEKFILLTNVEFSIDENLTRKNKKVIQKLFRFLNSLTYKKVYKICSKESGLKHSELKEIGDKKVIDLIVVIVGNLYKGNASYSPDTAEYKLTSGFLAVLDSVLFPFSPLLKKKIGIKSVWELVMPLVYNNGIDDYSAVINLNEYPKAGKHKKPVSLKGILFYIILLIFMILLLVPALIAGLVFAVKRLFNS